MLAVLVAALLSAAPGADTVITSDGARISGTVVEDSPTEGVTLQLPDGAIRKFQRREVARIEFSDGSTSSLRSEDAPAAQGGAPAPAPTAPPPPPPAPAPPPSAEARRGGPDGPVDTVFFIGGGRVRGTVLEESREGVTIRLLDGSVRQYPRREISRIIYADGSVSRRRTAPPRETYAYPPPRYRPAPPAYPPPYPPPAAPPYEQPEGWRAQGARPAPLYFAAGVGATFFAGRADKTFTMGQTFEPQGHLSLEGGLRLSPAIALGVYGDVGAGDPAHEARGECTAAGLTDCVATSGRIGFLLRHTWDPTTPTSKWMSIGTGWEFGRVSGSTIAGTNNDTELFTYKGREWARLAAGVDFRSNGVVGVGFYGGVAWGEYTRLEDPAGHVDLDGKLHTTVQVGVRLTLFP